MSYIQLPYGLKSKFDLICLKIIRNLSILKGFLIFVIRGLSLQINLLNLLRNGDDVKKWLLATSDFGRELQEDLTAIVGNNEKFNNAIARHVLDTKNAGIMQNPHPINLTFGDVKKSDLQNPIIGKIATQVKASKLTEDQLTKNILMEDEIAKIENRLEKMKRPINVNDGDDEDPGSDECGDDGAPPPLPPTPSPRRGRYPSCPPQPDPDQYYIPHPS